MRPIHRLCVPAFAAIFLSCPRPSAAGIYYGDGLTHTIDAAAPDVTLANGSTLRVDSGSAIVGGAGSGGVSGVSSNVVLTGGSVTGGAANPSTGGEQAGISLRGGSFEASGGSVTGGAGDADALGGDGLKLVNATASISGGTFRAASAFAPEFALLYSYTSPSATGKVLSISGGTFGGGGPNGYEAASITLDRASASISGGTFEGATGAARQVVGSLLSDGASLDISGGTFDGRVEASVLSGGGSLDFFGAGFAFTPTFDSGVGVEGLLTGTLLDGTAIDQDVLFLTSDGYRLQSEPGEFSFVSGPLTSNSVPEPASLLSTGLGLAALGLAARRRVRPS